MEYVKSFILRLYSDKLLILSIIIVLLLTIGNLSNKLLLGWEPLQYSLFSYDKILHLLSSVIIVRSLYIYYCKESSYKESKRLVIKVSVLTLLFYGLMWESFELITFYVQNSPQFWQELLDVPLDWFYDILGIFISNFLGYSN